MTTFDLDRAYGLDRVADDDPVRAEARDLRHLFELLVEEGFSDDQALAIVAFRGER